MKLPASLLGPYSHMPIRRLGGGGRRRLCRRLRLRLRRHLRSPGGRRCRRDGGTRGPFFREGSKTGPRPSGSFSCHSASRTRPSAHGPPRRPCSPSRRPALRRARPPCTRAPRTTKPTRTQTRESGPQEPTHHSTPPRRPRQPTAERTTAGENGCADAQKRTDTETRSSSAPAPAPRLAAAHAARPRRCATSRPRLEPATREHKNRTSNRYAIREGCTP